MNYIYSFLLLFILCSCFSKNDDTKLIQGINISNSTNQPIDIGTKTDYDSLCTLINDKLPMFGFKFNLNAFETVVKSIVD